MHSPPLRSAAARIWLVVLLGAPAAGRADQLRAPSTVIAQPDGTFDYRVKFYKEETADLLASYDWHGVENVAGGMSGDCFCFPGTCVLQPGDSVSFQVMGTLTDPAQPGSVYEAVNLCSSQGQSAVTTVLPHSATSVEQPVWIAALRLWNAPSPAAPRTVLYWEMPAAGRATLRLYDVAGRLVATLADGTLPAGRHQAPWDGGETRRGGVFFARLSALGLARTLPVVVVR